MALQQTIQPTCAGPACQSKRHAITHMSLSAPVLEQRGPKAKLQSHGGLGMCRRNRQPSREWSGFHPPAGARPVGRCTSSSHSGGHLFLATISCLHFHVKIGLRNTRSYVVFRWPPLGHTTAQPYMCQVTLAAPPGDGEQLPSRHPTNLLQFSISDCFRKYGRSQPGGRWCRDRATGADRKPINGPQALSRQGGTGKKETSSSPQQPSIW